MTQTILFSYDTLSNSQHRQDLKNESWTDFHEAHIDDEPNEDMIGLLNVLSEHYKIVVYSDMPSTFHQSMTEWLVDNEANVEEVLLAPNYSRGSIATKRIEAIRDGCDFGGVSFVFESNVSVAELLREEGLSVFECQ